MYFYNKSWKIYLTIKIGRKYYYRYTSSSYLGTFKKQIYSAQKEILPSIPLHIVKMEEAFTNKLRYKQQKQYFCFNSCVSEKTFGWSILVLPRKTSGSDTEQEKQPLMNLEKSPLWGRSGQCEHEQTSIICHSINSVWHPQGKCCAHPGAKLLLI